MITVILVIHLLIAIAMVTLILLQRSEGGALGIGGGGGFMTGRQAGNVLTRTTGILAAAFMTTSMLLALLANKGEDGFSHILDSIDLPSINSLIGGESKDAPEAGTPVEAPAGDSGAAPVGDAPAGDSGQAPAAPAADAPPAPPVSR
ncbi:preprotein translocase subunit SecG [Rhodospirillum rubrum]|uniref:Protein-export membrane protein SecG n=1 Tax=Rhodospirillum rubrum (strain ATCC 11170 / ATH 1.1.1 / DSM 467 / LMG 4362 / NCIMB 8255 / S1) TaxID=269796 RepID=Q2RT57_RHORT|nr:preprotein translocase subunit SecG [Rhodospirillum rubrum]ABC22688.1 protein translocase subunit secG [Rhodospirillum rubrum ATCC 11170]AEO48407.1 protein translocase subunit secG [Rhodospirillum rubrum F11]MBK5954286.1 preprotein translocase subunit SecG [Rhodospirillum rubrum]QXG78682.1 preprotein translocase subunit SecG [Rhodospirillum rubrum]HAQ00558.1 preprotein translocase subunit SecG [Rhodospirillum rubrum]